MTDDARTLFGPYELGPAIGIGGMGEVYQARDTRLNRTVAVKVLPASVAGDADRIARFSREAQLLASLSHPNIAVLHGFEVQGETQALIMEFVPGRTLAELTTAPMPVQEALAIARQIAAALEAAHEQHVVHRDLKPANIKVSDQGVVKVLDFGLAKLMATPTMAQGEASTVTSPALTEAGAILGTAAYMAPEQAKGKSVDGRADIWALGVVLFELLAGTRLYRAESVSETIALVITQAPDWRALPADTPGSVRKLLRRCLEKDPKQRFQAAGDVRIEIDEILGSSSTTAEVGGAAIPAPSRASWWTWAPWVLSAGLIVVLAYLLWPRSTVPSRQVRFDVQLTAGESLDVDVNVDGPIAVLSPDGRSVVYLASDGAARQLYVRAVDGTASRPIPGTRGAFQPFFSPDSRVVAFYAGGQLKAVPIDGGTPAPVVGMNDMRGGTWGDGNTIVYSPGFGSGLWRVPSTGGSPMEVTTLAAGERTHRWPSFLPGGKVVLFMCQRHDGAYDEGTIEAVHLDTGTRTVLVRGGTFPRYVGSGHVVFTRGNALMAVPFDLQSLSVLGEARPIIADVLASGAAAGAGSGNGAAQFSVANNGSAVYISGAQAAAGDPALAVLAVLDRRGTRVYAYPEPREFRDPAFVGANLSIAVRVADVRSAHIHRLDPSTNTLTKLTFEGGLSGFPVPSPDGRRLAFASDRGGVNLTPFLMNLDGTSVAPAIADATLMRTATSFSPDGTLLALIEVNPKTNTDMVVASLVDGSVRPFVATPASELAGTFSPDGKWMAYMSAEANGDPQIFVRDYPDGRIVRQLSTGGGFSPKWTRGGREIVFGVPTAAGASMMAVDVATDGRVLLPGAPRKLFDVPLSMPGNSTWYDVNRAGDRFVVLLSPERPADAAPRTHVTFVLDLFDDIRRAFAPR